MSTSILTVTQYTRETRRNRVVNPSAEVNTTGWLAARATLSRDTTQARRGIASFKVTPTDTGGPQYLIAGAGTADRAPVVGGETVDIVASVRTTATTSFGFQLYEYDAAGVLITPVLSSAYTSCPAGVWTDLAATFTTKVNAASVRIVVLPQTVVALNAPYWVDCIGAGINTYFDGTTAPVAGYTYAWAGTAHASASIERLTEPHTITPELVDGFEASRPAGNIVHDIMDRSDPDVTLRAAGLRRGAFKCLFPDQTVALAAYAEISEPQLFQIIDPDVPAIGMTFIVGPAGSDIRLTLDDETRSVWWLEVPFVEVST